MGYTWTAWMCNVLLMNISSIDYELLQRGKEVALRDIGCKWQCNSMIGKLFRDAISCYVDV